MKSFFFGMSYGIIGIILFPDLNWRALALTIIIITGEAINHNMEKPNDQK